MAIRYIDYCSECSNNCCVYTGKDGFIAIGIKDAIRIRKRYSLEYKDFLEFSRFPEEAMRASSSQPNSEFILKKILSPAGNILRIRQTKEGRCMFLQKGNTCGIYSCRPLTCRMYPFGYMNKGGKRVITGCNQPDICPLQKAFTRGGTLSLEPALRKSLESLSGRIESEFSYHIKNIERFAREYL